MTALDEFPTLTVFEFRDGEVWPIYDSELDEHKNAVISKALELEGKRRLRVGQSDTGVIRVQQPADNAERIGEILKRVLAEAADVQAQRVALSKDGTSKNAPHFSL